MPPPENGNEYIDFTKLVALEKISANVFRSTALAFSPANGNRTYGGHVYMQACYAAAQTVPKGFALHVRFYFVSSPTHDLRVTCFHRPDVLIWYPIASNRLVPPLRQSQRKFHLHRPQNTGWRLLHAWRGCGPRKRPDLLFHLHLLLQKSRKEVITIPGREN